jgi:hypothetical protein
MTAARPNERLVRLGWLITNHAALVTTQALETINERLARLDGNPTRGEQVSVSTSTPTSTTEAIALQRYTLDADREQMRDDIAALEQMVDDYLRMVRRVIGRPLAEDQLPTMALCRDGQVGKHAADEWGDPLCPLPAVKGGLCSAHWWQWYRARRRDGIDVRRDHEAGV